jgi:hypothetical protein
LIGGVYVGDLTNRNFVTNPMQAQVIPGALKTGGVGTALLGPSQDGTCKAIFAVVTADGAIVQEHTKKGLDGLAPRGTVRPVLGGDGNAQQEAVEPRFGVIMNPYTNSSTVVRQLFVSEPFYNTIAVLDLVIVPTPNQGFANQVFSLGSLRRIGSSALNLPVDLTPVKRIKIPPTGQATRHWITDPTSTSPTRATTRSFACGRTARSSRSDASRSTATRSTMSA